MLHGDRVGDRDAREAAATKKGLVADAGDRAGDRDAHEAAALTKGLDGDAGRAVRDGHGAVAVGFDQAARVAPGHTASRNDGGQATNAR